MENEKQEIFSERVRAGKRTYFFDVKATRSNDYYLTITESKRRYKDDGYTYEKHKIFLYKEDFNKFLAALSTTVDHVKSELMPEVDFDKFDEMRESGRNNDSSQVNGENSDNNSNNTLESTEVEVTSTDSTGDDDETTEKAETTESDMDTELKWD